MDELPQIIENTTHKMIIDLVKWEEKTLHELKWCCVCGTERPENIITTDEIKAMQKAGWSCIIIRDKREMVLCFWNFTTKFNYSQKIGWLCPDPECLTIINQKLNNAY